MKTIALTCTVLFLAFYSIAQSKPKALKFDEIVLDDQMTYLEADSLIKERVERFTKKLRFERSKNVFIVLYRARVLQDSNRNTLNNIAGSAKWSISSKIADSNDVLVIDGGLRQQNTVEFWIAPEGELPTATPTFTRSEGIECPSIFAYQAGFSFDKQTPVVLTVEAHPSGADAYNWTLTDGQIIGPNGRTRLEVDVRQVEGNKLTAFVELEGIPLPCKNRAMVVAEFGNTARLMDEFGRVTNEDIQSRLDYLMATLSEHPKVQGFAFVYGGRNARGKDIEARKRLFANHFRFRGFDGGRITLVNAGYREDISTEVWLVPPGVAVPETKPSVDAALVPVTRPPRRKRAIR